MKFYSKTTNPNAGGATPVYEVLTGLAKFEFAITISPSLLARLSQSLVNV